MNAVYINPLRPSAQEPEGAPVAEGWDQISDADVLADHVVDRSEAEEKDDEVGADDQSEVQVPLGLPDPPQPSKEEIARHNLTHVNYRS